MMPWSNRRLRFAVFFGAGLWAVSAALAVVSTALADDGPLPSPDDPQDVEFFEKQVRPLLAARCHGCHGAEKQKGNLRLDSRAAVLKGGDTAPAVAPGKPDDSLLVDAIRYGDTYQMPPKSQLPREEIEILVEWVRRGAPWGRDVEKVADAPGAAAPVDVQSRAGHWSFRPIARVEPPAVRDSAWVKTPIDRFILAKLEAGDLAPASPTDKYTLLRRVTYDLTGLPPTPEEIDAFVRDDSPTAYLRVVERLLASPHYGERWARHWLDLVRYAETHGHEFDYDLPNAYRYRDYLIRAFNADLPYDRFVVEHVAGDLLLPSRRHPTENFNESIIATGWFFLGEAKHSPVDVRQDEADRIDNQIDVFAKTFLGLTVSCARCHDHKFDPISTKDYYALAGYLQSSRYQQAFIDSPQQRSAVVAELQAIRAARQQACTQLVQAALQPEVLKLAETMTSPAASATPPTPWTDSLTAAKERVDDVLHPWAVLASADVTEENFADALRKLRDEPAAPRESSGSQATVLVDFSASSSYSPWQTTGAAFGDAPGGAMDWMFVGPRKRFPGRLLGAGAAHSGMISTKLRGTLRSPTFEITAPKIFYRLYGNGGQVRLILDGLQLIQDPIYGGLKFDPGGETPHWHAQDVSKWVGHKAYIELIDDGDCYLALEQVVLSDTSPAESTPNRLIRGLLDKSTIFSRADLARAYQSCASEALADWLANPDRASDDAKDRAAIVAWVLEGPLGERTSDDAWRACDAACSQLDLRQRELEDRLEAPRQALAMADGTAENEHVFVRGSHKTLGEEVPRRFLEVLGGVGHLPPAEGSGRLELARQMIAPANPLLSRVMVNRIWQHDLGEGLVRSPDDFGAMGQAPTHPELLDYLAGEFVHGGWSIKEMHRLIVLSSTYSMSSQLQERAESVDPQNKLWHRATLRRLEAECIRDAMLAVSGRADAKLYGPSVMPHLTPYMAGRGRPTTSGPVDGAGRRSIYLAVRRNFLSPMFQAFDYPTPFTTIGRRSVSNVPAQALAMLNNPFVLEQAAVWADRVVRTPHEAASDRVRRMYLSALARPPQESELQAALSFLGETSDGKPGDDPGAWTDFAHVLFNLKEFIFIP